MKKVLLASVILVLCGCGDVTAESSLPVWNSNFTLVKSFRFDNNIYVSSNGNCYLQYSYGNKGSVSKVDCEDFNVKVGNQLTNKSKPVTDNSTELLEYIRDYCVVDNHYEDFPRVKGTPSVKELQGKKLSCTLPDNIDKSINERVEYLRLKAKFGG